MNKHQKQSNKTTTEDNKRVRRSNRTINIKSELI